MEKSDFPFGTYKQFSNIQKSDSILYDFFYLFIKLKQAEIVVDVFRKRIEISTDSIYFV